MLHSSFPAAAGLSGRRTGRVLRCAALALSLGLAGHLAHAAAGTSRATDPAPRAGEIEWIDLSDYNYALASSAAGQNFSITLLDGRTLRFRLKYANNGPDPSAFVPVASPVSYSLASFGRTGYLGIAGTPIIKGVFSGTVEISNIQVSDANGHLFAFEWVAADAETTASSSATRKEFIEFESNGASWVQVASLPLVDGTPNVETLQISGSPSVARIQQDDISSAGGAYVLSTSNPTNIKFTYGTSAPPYTNQQAAAFGIIPSQTVMGSLAPASVPANHPLLLLSIALALGWLARRKFRTA